MNTSLKCSDTVRVSYGIHSVHQVLCVLFQSLTPAYIADLCRDDQAELACTAAYSQASSRQHSYQSRIKIAFQSKVHYPRIYAFGFAFTNRILLL